MTKGQLKTSQNERQQGVEKQMGYIGVTLAMIQHDRLRVEQALRRTGLRDLLQPVLTDYQQIERVLRSVQDEIRKTWDEGQQSRWNMPE